jgi:hypothetical protein
VRIAGSGERARVQKERWAVGLQTDRALEGHVQAFFDVAAGVVDGAHAAVADDAKEVRVVEQSEDERGVIGREAAKSESIGFENDGHEVFAAEAGA